MLTAFTAALLLITISELGDKTFFIAVIMAMRYPRRLVFIGVIAALAAMTILSVFIGQAVAFLPREYTSYGAIILFFFFGAKLLYDAWKMPETTECEAIEEAQEALAKSDKNLQRHNNNWGVMLETFILTFLAEWGDRTQIATITLAAAYKSPVAVTLGAILGHTICALIAVMGSKLIAGRLSERKVTAIGGALFLVFAVVTVTEVI